MEKIEELREITQKSKVEGRERPWLYRLLQRGPSIYITALFIKTRITPNQVSLLSIAVGIVGFFFLLSELPALFILGVALFYFNILLDKVDGEVARYKKIFSLRGAYLDEINHLSIPALFFFGVTLHLLLHSAHPLFPIVIFGTLASLSMTVIRTGWSLAPQIYAKKYKKHPELFTLPEPGEKTTVEELKSRRPFLITVLKIIHQFQEFFMIILLFFLASFLDLGVIGEVRWYLFIFLGIFLPLVVVENTIKGYFSVEQRIADINDRFSK